MDQSGPGIALSSFPELEGLLKKLTRSISLHLLEHLPTPQSLLDIRLADLTQIVRQASREQKGEGFAVKLRAAAEASVGLSDHWLESELRLTIRQFITVTDNIKALEEEIKALTDLLLQEYSEDLNLAKPLTLKSFPYGTYLSLGTVLAELGPLDRFKSLKHLLSYLVGVPTPKRVVKQKCCTRQCLIKGIGLCGGCYGCWPLASFARFLNIKPIIRTDLRLERIG